MSLVLGRVEHLPYGMVTTCQKGRHEQFAYDASSYIWHLLCMTKLSGWLMLAELHPAAGATKQCLFSTVASGAVKTAVERNPASQRTWNSRDDVVVRPRL